MEKDLNARHEALFTEHLEQTVRALCEGLYTIDYIHDCLNDLTERVYAYMLRGHLDSFAVFGCDIREKASSMTNIWDYHAWMCNVVSDIYLMLKEKEEGQGADIRHRIEMIIDEELENDISLTLVADRLGMKTYELSRIFTKVMDKNYIDYVKQKKLLKAVGYLRQGIPVQEIASRLGYHTSQYFIRIFKETFGTTPYQYRKNVLESRDSADK